MAPHNKRFKPHLISIYSSSEEEDDEEIQQESESESEDEDTDDNDYDDEQVLEISSSISSEEDDDDNDDDDDDDDGNYDDESESDDQEYEDYENFENQHLDDDELIGDRVICFLRERNDLQELSLKECKGYLREHGLRLSGTKSECIQRIKEHWRIKDGSGEALYPRDSFSINCTGDVCKGDVVLFTQKVYKKFDKVTRSGNCLGKRTVAGRIVKESYGATKQQHTFTVEVLWSKGIKKLRPLCPLLVKGRNLYKLKTYRQRWKSEAKRSAVLAEKHRRGAAARQIRAMRKTEKMSHSNSGSKRQKLLEHRQTRTRQPAGIRKGKFSTSPVAAPVRNVKPNTRSRKLAWPEQVNLTRPNVLRPVSSQLKSDPSQYFRHYQREYVQQNAPLASHSSGVSSAATMRFPYNRAYLDSCGMPASEIEGFNRSSYHHRGYTHSTYGSVPRNFSQYHRSSNTYRPPPPPFLR